MDKIECKVGKKHTDGTSILKKLKGKLLHVFDYIETDTELKYSIKNYKIYYNNNYIKVNKQ